ncbi:MAG: DNA (cytosine-5-)-methyltransferase [Acidimicrobiaceae bacterium]|nr:DNA (cytosine-5-)-methyltransferase [Acidimicrobiaceae bacterium]
MSMTSVISPRQTALSALRAVDLFCGCGGLSKGLISAGIDVAEAYDCWPQALETYVHNIGGHAVEFDLSDVDATSERISSLAPDLVVGAPPCQDFSTAGKRIEAGHANLTIAFGRILARCKPPAFLMENVPQVRLSETYKRMRQTVSAEGYTVVETVLDASWYGVPQIRRRFFAFGYLGNGDQGERFEQYLDAKKATQRLTVKQYMGGEINIEFYYRHPRNYSRRSVFSVHEPSPTVRGVNRPVPPKYAGNHLDSVPPSEVRPLTTRERGRVQTFPIEWEWDGRNRNADTELQIGNAVPVQLAERVAEAVQYTTQP